ncbi:unnamed protein product [Cladocopium goreaui]|uniref:Peptidyl-prolyl cis-trans isomerase G n=1 Tax=Cladocopium goreaui TaxID=2562237 RepID=A0A9P1GJB0_9DINO|nr:unnamed protein product [Cladocopium goreaui]
MAEHMQLATEEGQEMLLEEIPESPSAKPRHWYLAGAGLALLVVLGVAAKVVYRSPETLLQSKNFDINTVQEWEQIPGIDQVVEHAKTLELKQPLRNLNDLFYESQPEELPWIRTECVIDVVQGAAYLGQAVVFLYKAIKYDGIRCPDNSPAGCAASIAGFITSVTWIASYLSFAANACGAAVNSGALCAGDWTALMANFGEMATVGAAVKEDCDFNKDWLALLKITGTDDAGPGWKTFVPAGAMPTVETVQKVDALRTADRNRAFDLTQCVVADVTNAAAYIVRAILQIRSAASACPEPKACAINIMNIISSFAWISQFTSLAVSDCWDKGSQKALCAADISDMVAAVTNGPAAGIATTSDCADMPDPLEEEKHLPMEMLLEEIPESPSAKPRHWYLAGAGLALLVVLGVAAKVVYRSPETLLQSKNFDINTVQEWEQIPGIDQVVEHAKTLELKQPLRNLNDLFYESQPEAVVFLYKAIKYDGIRCPDNSPAGCAASIAGFITSVTWIASYLSFAANACGAAVNSGALCAGDWTALMANFGEMATVGAAVKEDCDFNKVISNDCGARQKYLPFSALAGFRLDGLWYHTLFCL